MNTIEIQEHKKQINALRNAAKRFEQLGMKQVSYKTYQQASEWEAWLIKKQGGSWFEVRS